jgi:hypothetical protein
MEEAAGRLKVVLAECHQADAELEALWTSTAIVRDLILGDASRSSSLAASLALMAEEVVKWVNAMTANGVWWGTRSALVTALSHFPELEVYIALSFVGI